MRIVTPVQHHDRVEAVLTVIQDMTGRQTLPPACRAGLAALGFEELGRLAMELVASRSLDLVPGLLEQNLSIPG